jgi:hypothetical protein
MAKTNEIWKSIEWVGCEDYIISNKGRVKNRKTGRCLKNKDGFATIRTKYQVYEIKIDLFMEKYFGK